MRSLETLPAPPSAPHACCWQCPRVEYAAASGAVPSVWPLVAWLFRSLPAHSSFHPVPGPARTPGRARSGIYLLPLWISLPRSCLSIILFLQTLNLGTPFLLRGPETSAESQGGPLTGRPRISADNRPSLRVSGGVLDILWPPITASKLPNATPSLPLRHLLLLR